MKNEYGNINKKVQSLQSLTNLRYFARENSKKLVNFLPFLISPLFIVVLLKITVFSKILTGYASILDFDGWDNYIGFLLYLPISILCLIFLPAKQRYIRGIIQVFITISGALLALYIAFSFIYNTQSEVYGQSGIVWSFIGTIIGTAISDFVVYLLYRKIAEALFIGGSLLVYLLPLVVQFGIIFGVNQFGIAWQIHILSFAAGIILGFMIALVQQLGINTAMKQKRNLGEII